MSGLGSPHVLVLAKSPEPGKVKTRLCPPCTPAEAAEIAAAALADTLEEVTRSGAYRFLLALDGPVGPWIPPVFEVFPQRGDGFDERLANAWDDAGGPGVQVGMDTPQLTATRLDEALDLLGSPAVDAVLGGADDGGWWLIGLTDPDPAVFLGVPMSTASTGTAQRRRLHELGLRTASVAPLRDVDTFADALVVAADSGCGPRFAAAVRAQAARSAA